MRPRRGANRHDGRLCEIHGCALAEDPTPNSASARIYRPDRAPSRYTVDAVRSAWGDARWRRWSRSAEPRSACGRSPLPASRQAPTSSHRGTANPVVENSPRDSQTLLLVARKGAGASCPRCQFSRQSTTSGFTNPSQYMCWPPLTESVEPVMKSASSATRNRTAREMSSGLPRRPTGIRAMIFVTTSAGTARTMSVLT
jgi:hypothetical protein